MKMPSALSFHSIVITWSGEQEPAVVTAAAFLPDDSALHAQEEQTATYLSCHVQASHSCDYT